jgi:predicted ATPase
MWAAGWPMRCGASAAHAMPLAQLVHEKTGGNPFFVIQFLSALVENGRSSTTMLSGRWSWDPERSRTGLHRQRGGAHRRQAGSPGGANAGGAAAARLPWQQRRATRLSLILGTSEDELHAQLADAVAAELVERQDSAYRFIHDRVRKPPIPDPGRRALPRTCASAGCSRHTPCGQARESIFEIVGQLNRGAELIDSPEEREQLADSTCLPAAARRRPRRMPRRSNISCRRGPVGERRVGAPA